MDIAFADYMTGSRALDPSEFVRPLSTPFFAADTVLTLFASSRVAEGGGLVFRVPETARLPLLKNEREVLHAAQRAALQAGASTGAVLQTPISGATTVLVRESANDYLTGLRVEWSHTPKAGRADFVSLVAANSDLERVAF